MNSKKTESNSPQFLRKRKKLLVLPLLVLPFVTMIFWALGGGSADATQKTDPSGLNLQLPNAHLKDDRSETKLSFYEQADRDSLKLGRQSKSDSFLQFQEPKDTSLFHATHDPNEEKVYQKLAQLNQQLNTSAVKGNSNGVKTPVNRTSPVNTEDVERLDQLMQNINKRDSVTDDPEMNNLNGMMEKILDIQHPERVKERMQAQHPQNKVNIFSVNKVPIISSVSLLDTSTIKQSDGFFGLDEENNSNPSNAIEAVVHENQTLVSGAIIKLRLVNDISINGNIIPKDNFVFGMVSLSGERLEVEISSIRVNNSLFPVKLTVYDMDGLSGIYIPGAITRDVAKQSLDNAAQMMEISSMDPSVAAQATSAGISAVKTLLSKKTKLVKVTVKANYKVLLK